MKIDFRSIDVAKRLSQVVHGEIVSPADQVERYWEYQARQREGGITLPWGKTHGLFEFKPGTLTMLGGYTGHFKSTISAQMMLSAMEQGKRVGLASLELEMPQIMDQLIDIASLNGDRPTREWKEGFSSGRGTSCMCMTALMRSSQRMAPRLSMPARIWVAIWLCSMR